MTSSPSLQAVVVDDVNDSAAFAKHILESRLTQHGSLNHVVTRFCYPGQVLQALRANELSLTGTDLWVSDFSMSEMTGAELIATLFGMLPDDKKATPFLLISVNDMRDPELEAAYRKLVAMQINIRFLQKFNLETGFTALINEGWIVLAPPDTT